MGEYYSCKGCGNTQAGDSIYRCCNKTYCSSCVKGIMSNLIHSRCPECGGLAQYLGKIESRASSDSSSDDDSSSFEFNSDDDIDSTLSKLMRYVRAQKDNMSSERKEKLSEILNTLDWSEYPYAETVYDELNS